MLLATSEIERSVSCRAIAHVESSLVTVLASCSAAAGREGGRGRVQFLTREYAARLPRLALRSSETIETEQKRPDPKTRVPELSLSPFFGDDRPLPSEGPSCRRKLFGDQPSCALFGCTCVYAMLGAVAFFYVLYITGNDHLGLVLNFGAAFPT